MAAQRRDPGHHQPDPRAPYPDEANELDDDETVRQKLSKLRDRILKGEDFAGIASTASEDPGSAPDGGDLGWTGPGTFVPEFSRRLRT